MTPLCFNILLKRVRVIIKKIHYNFKNELAGTKICVTSYASPSFIFSPFSSDCWQRIRKYMGWRLQEHQHDQTLRRGCRLLQHRHPTIS